MYSLSHSSLPSLALPRSSVFSLFQVMETKNMLYLVTEYAKNGEIFGELSFQVQGQSDLKHYLTMSFLQVSVAHKRNLPCCVSNVFDKQGSIKVLLSLRCSRSYPGLKGLMIDGYLRKMSWYGPRHVLLVIAILKVFLTYKMTSLRGSLKERTIDLLALQNHCLPVYCSEVVQDTEITLNLTVTTSLRLNSLYCLVNLDCAFNLNDYLFSHQRCVLF